MTTAQVRPGGIGNAGDLSIATLSADVPGDVITSLMPPASLSAKWNPELEARTPAVILPANPGRVARSVILETSTVTWTSGRTDIAPNSYPFAYLPYGGDSGSPVFFVLGSQRFAISHCFFATLGPNYAVMSAEVQALVEADGESLSFADLSSYATLY